MKNPWMFILAAGILLGSQAAILLCARQNRAGDPGGSVELTERELSILAQAGESTVVVLGLNWSVHPETAGVRGSPAWLTPATLQELGFDCRKAAADPEARAHYAAQLARPAFLVLELGEESGSRPQAPSAGGNGSRLRVVDAALDPQELRKRHPDPGRFLIVNGLVGVSVRTHRDDRPEKLPEPVVCGWIRGIQPSQILVSPPWSRQLEPFIGRTEGPEREASEPPRYAVSVSWGERYEPWVTGVRLLTAGSIRME